MRNSLSLRLYLLLFAMGTLFCPPPNCTTAAQSPRPNSSQDFNQDGKPDFVAYNPTTDQTAIWYLHNNVLASGVFGPTLPPGWRVVGTADFNGDGHPDYALFSPITRQTAIWYLSGASCISSAYGPSLPGGWELAALADFNGDGNPDYVLYNSSTNCTAIWYLNKHVLISAAFGPTLPAGWRVAGVADFNGDGQPDYLLCNASSRQSAIWYLSGGTFTAGVSGPAIANGYALLGAADFNGDGKPDYVLYNPTIQRTALNYLSDNLLIGSAYGPNVAAGWKLSPASPASVPHGVFSLGSTGVSINAAVLANKAVDGVSLRMHWSDLEPAEGVYNWNYFDGQIARVAAAGKKVLLRVATGGDNIPSWVMTAVSSAGGSTFTFTDSAAHTIPVFWDATLLAKKNAMIAAMGARYSRHPAVQAVAVSFASAISEDWSVPHNTTPDAGYSTSEVTRWRNAGYTSQKMIYAGNLIINTTMRAFPNQVVVLAVGGDGDSLDLPADSNYVARMVVATARTNWGATRLVVAKNNLATTTPLAPPPVNSSASLWYNSRPAIASQTLWFCYNDPTYRNTAGAAYDPATTLRRCIDIGRSYGMAYVEIYETDVVNLPAVIDYAHSVL